MLSQAEHSFGRSWVSLPDAQRLRLGGMEEALRGIVPELEPGLCEAVARKLDELALEVFGQRTGGVSLGFCRAVTDLTTGMTFGDAGTSMKELHEP